MMILTTREYEKKISKSRESNERCVCACREGMPRPFASCCSTQNAKAKICAEEWLLLYVVSVCLA